MDCTHANVKCRNCDAVLKTECLPFYLVQRMETENAKLRAMLRRLEFNFEGWCELCGEREHKSDCELAAALGEK